MGLLYVLIVSGCLGAIAGVVHAQSVAMSGEYGESLGRWVNIPLNPPQVPCSNFQNARCHQGSVDFVVPSPDLLAEPSYGVGVSGAGVVVMPGGLNVGDPFTIPPEVFKQKAQGVVNSTPVVNNVGVVQLNTTITAVMPAAARAVNPPANTRIFEAGAWSQPGNGMTGRAAATTTPVSAATQTANNITLRYTAGPNAFGGTMANLLDGEGTVYLTGPAVMSSAGNPSTRPWVGTNPMGDGIVGNPQTANGAGWGYTRMGTGAGGVVRNFGGISPACTQVNPPGQAGCGLVTKVDGETIFTFPSSATTKFMYAYTTGTVTVLTTFTVSLGGSQILTAMGYDTVSGTGTSAVRNVGLVAGSYTRRTSSEGTQTGHQIIGLDMQFTPEPAGTAALLGGLGMLGVLARRRSSKA